MEKNKKEKQKEKQIHVPTVLQQIRWLDTKETCPRVKGCPFNYCLKLYLSLQLHVYLISTYAFYLLLYSLSFIHICPSTHPFSIFFLPPSLHTIALDSCILRVVSWAVSCSTVVLSALQKIVLSSITQQITLEDLSGDICSSKVTVVSFQSYNVCDE